ncbi:XF1762 family protein [Streptomyces pinistramenti]|uniref:XF1762 family protein n=1 Tax=Streptomyces pinistramenti TaxID=2884812 RepID=UPI003557514B
MRRLTIIPPTFGDACEVVDRLHRKPQGHRFSIGMRRPTGALCGVAIVGRPMSRIFDNRLTSEVTRVATARTRTRAAQRPRRRGPPDGPVSR